MRVRPGTRALGVAESYRGDASTLAGAVVRADRVVDGFSFADCTVGGTDATAAITGLFDALDREDVRALLVAGIAPAWYNVIDLHAVHDAVGRPVVSVSFEESEGLEAAIREAFDGEEARRRLERYRAQPPRRACEMNGERVFVRAVGLDAGDARDLVRAYAPEGGRPEPLRVARLAARGADAWRRQSEDR